MNLTRREIFSKLGIAAAAAGVVAEVQAVEPEPKPLLFVLKVPGRISSKAKENMEVAWKHIWNGYPPAPIIILPEGLTLDVIRK